jgi:hypothetical protein
MRVKALASPCGSHAAAETHSDLKRFTKERQKRGIRSVASFNKEKKFNLF